MSEPAKEKKEKKHHHKDHKKDDPDRAKRREARKERRDKKEKDKKEKKDKKGDKAAAPAAAAAAAAAPAAQPKVAPKPDSILGEDVNVTPIESIYTLGRQLGSGAFSVVKEGVHKKDGSKVAVKVIQKTTVAGEDIKLLRREITNLKTLDHPNILKLYEVYEDKQQFYLVMELVQGKELFDKIVERGQYSERDASHITRQFVSAIEYLHSKGIAHRDLKPENILSVGSGEKEVIKVADFGLSKNFGDEKMMTSCGSPGYVAPEVLECETYDKAVDLWSIGVILYILLVGYPPFYADSDPALFKKIMACDYSFGEGWDVVSESAKDLIKHLLVKDPKQRFTAVQALNHPWLKQGKDLSEKQLQMSKLKDFVTKRALPK